MHETYRYVINWEKVQTLDDMKLIIEAIQVTFGSENKHLASIMHLVTREDNSIS